jgi:hypothetical protein
MELIFSGELRQSCGLWAGGIFGSFGGDPSSFESSMPNTRGIPVHVPVDLLNHDYVPLVFRIHLL